VLALLVVGLVGGASASETASIQGVDDQQEGTQSGNAYAGFRITVEEDIELLSVNAHDYLENSGTAYVYRNGNLIDSASVGSDVADFSGSPPKLEGGKTYEVIHPSSTTPFHSTSGGFDKDAVNYDQYIQSCDSDGTNCGIGGGTGYTRNFWELSYNILNSPPQFNSTSVDPDPPLIGENVSYSAEVFDSDGSVSYTNLTLEYGGSTVLSDVQRGGTTTPEWNDIFTPQTGDKWLNATFEVVDDAGAVTTTEINRYLTDSNPNVTINKPDTSIKDSNTVSWNVSTENKDSKPNESLDLKIYKNGNLENTYSITEGDTQTGSLTYNDGTGQTFKAEAVENDGDTDTETVKFDVDTTPPQIDILHPVNSSDTRTNVDLNLTVTDPNLDSSKCSYQIDDKTAQSIPNCENTTIQFDEVGTHEITVEAEDTLGNKNSTTVNPFIDHENTVKLEDKVSSSSISNFTVSLSQSNSSTGAGGSTSNGEFNFFTSEIPDGDVNMTLKADEYKTKTVLLQNVDRSFTLDKTYQMERAGVSINVFDERNNDEQLDFDYTAIGQSTGETYNGTNVTSIDWDYDEIPSGFPKGQEVKLTISDSDSNYQDSLNYDSYRPRDYIIEVNENTKTSLDAYLLEKGAGIFVTVEVLDDKQENLQGALVNIQRNFENYKTVSSKRTQTDGTASFYLDPDSSYKALVTKAGYSSFDGTFSPVNYQTSPLTIALGTQGTFIESNVWDSIQYSIKPEQRRLNTTGNQTFNYTITDSQSELEEVGLRLYNENGTQILEESITGTPSGTSVVGELNLDNYNPDNGEELTLRGFFVKDGELYKNEKQYVFRSALDTGPFSIDSIFSSADGLGDMTKSILALLIVSLAGSKLKSGINKKGGGLITLTILGMFVVKGWFDSFTFLLTLLTLIGLYGTR
jgi:hypothetical protein